MVNGILLEITLNGLSVLYIVWLTLKTAPISSISVGALSVCEFAMVPGVYILMCPQEEEVHSSS